MLNEVVRKRVLFHEAKKQRIDKSDTYKDKIKELRKGLILGLFIDKVVASTIKMNEDELKAFYDENTDSYTSPRMMKIDSVVFNGRKNADDAIATLRSGTEFKWLRANAAGQAGQDAKGLLDFGGSILSVSSLPEDVQKVLSGVNSEDYRLYESADGYFYVLHIQQVFPPTIEPYEKVRQEIVKKIYDDKLTQAVKGWSDKLKAHYPVEIYFTEF